MRAALIVSPLVACIVFPLLLPGCGGGTTGTSPTGGFQLVGITEDAKRAPIASTSMSVLSGTGDNLILESQTDQNGDFTMELPNEEAGIIVDVQGTRSTPLMRKLQGTSVVSTKLSQNASGALAFADTFEVQVDPSRLCRSLETENNQIVQTTEIVDTECPVTLVVRSSDANYASIEASVRSGCADRTVSSRASSAGDITINLAPVLTSRCDRIEIVVSRVDAPLREAVFPVFAGQ